jgi:hypothetical protein
MRKRLLVAVAAAMGACSPSTSLPLSPCLDPRSPLVCPDFVCCPTGLPYQCGKKCYSGPGPCGSSYSVCRAPGSTIADVAAVREASGRFGAIMAAKDGETLMPLVARDASGAPTGVTGAVWSDNRGGSVAVYLGANGLPERAVMTGFVLLFSWNASAGTVDIAKVYTPSGYIELFKGVQTSVVALAGKLPATCFPACGSDAKNLAEMLKLAGLGISVGLCGVGLAALEIVAVPPCAGVIVKTATLLVGDEQWLDGLDRAGTVFSSMGCAVEPPECLGLALEYGGKIVDVLGAEENGNGPLLTAARAFLADPNRKSGVAQSGGGLPVCTQSYQCAPGHYLPCYPEGTKQCLADCTWTACPSVGGVPDAGVGGGEDAGGGNGETWSGTFTGAVTDGLDCLASSTNASWDLSGTLAITTTLAPLVAGGGGRTSAIAYAASQSVIHNYEPGTCTANGVSYQYGGSEQAIRVSGATIVVDFSSNGGGTLSGTEAPSNQGAVSGGGPPAVGALPMCDPVVGNPILTGTIGGDGHFSGTWKTSGSSAGGGFGTSEGHGLFDLHR